ncbi:MAG: hypothetical protein KGM16_14300 [Bacteroidota bacterium]|nr:hypothetical protein [Bacteroidota bacterium]
MIDSIEDENTLQMLMEDVAYYTGDNDVAEDLSQEQLKELDDAISEADKNETVDWNDFKKEMNEWKKR